MISDNWKWMGSMTKTLLQFTKTIDTWNKTIFGYIGTKNKILIAKIRGIQKTLCSKSSSFLRQLESGLLMDLECLLDQEEKMWKQKSWCDWITQGDRNTRYFHRKAISRKQRNHISSLKLLDGTWCVEDSMLQDEAIRFFSSLFSA
ncbi:hypothetical protein V6N13_099444 [Hibiscus sabdariffa]